jgi:hypothetical protein
MDYIKIVLLVYLVLRLVNFIPNQNFTLDNFLQNTLLVLLLILLAAHDPSVCLLIIVAILINTPNQYREKLFTNIDKNEIKNITNTLQPSQPSQPSSPSPKDDTNTQVKTSSTKSTNKNDCIPEFIISKKMLSNAQNNIFDEKNMNVFPNEINESDVNIQGVFNDIKGYNTK